MAPSSHVLEGISIPSWSIQAGSQPWLSIWAYKKKESTDGPWAIWVRKPGVMGSTLWLSGGISSPLWDGHITPHRSLSTLSKTCSPLSGTKVPGDDGIIRIIMAEKDAMNSLCRVQLTSPGLRWDEGLLIAQAMQTQDNNVGGRDAHKHRLIYVIMATELSEFPCSPLSSKSVDTSEKSEGRFSQVRKALLGWKASWTSWNHSSCLSPGEAWTHGLSVSREAD